MFKLSLNLDVFVSNLSGDLLHSFYHTYTIREVRSNVRCWKWVQKNLYM